MGSELNIFGVRVSSHWVNEWVWLGALIRQCIISGPFGTVTKTQIPRASCEIELSLYVIELFM